MKKVNLFLNVVRLGISVVYLCFNRNALQLQMILFTDYSLWKLTAKAGMKSLN